MITEDGGSSRLTDLRGKLMLPIILAIMLLVPTYCRGEIYLGGYVGGVFTPNVNPYFETTDWWLVTDTRTAKNVGVDPAFLVGGKIGYWFDKVPIIGYQLPNFMKYFGLELDISYHGLRWPNQRVTVQPTNRTFDLQMNGDAISICFLFMGRYGFLPDKVVPFGRLQPYIGLGPMVVISTHSLNQGIDYKSTEGDLGFALETGLRYFFAKKFSGNVALRYRYVKAHMDADSAYVFDISTFHRYVPMHTRYNFIDFIVGVAYHFK